MVKFASIVLNLLLINLCGYCQCPTFISEFLEKIQSASNAVQEIGLEVDVQLKYFSRPDTSGNRITYEIVKNPDAYLGFEFNARDYINKGHQWSCNDSIYSVSSDDTIDVTDDIYFFERNRWNGLIVKWLNPNFSKNIIEDTSIIKYDLSFDKITNLYTLFLQYKPLDDNVEYYNMEYIFQGETLHLIQMVNMAKWEVMEQMFKYKVLNTFSIEKKESFCGEEKKYPSFLINRLRPEINNNQKFDSLKVLPNFVLAGTGNKPISSESITKPMLIYFWYLGCYPCRKTTPIIDSLHNLYSADSLMIMGINPYDNVENILDYYQKKNLEFVTLYGAKEYCKEIGLFSYPTIVLLNSNKEIYYVSQGYFDNMKEEIVNKINELLK